MAKVFLGFPYSFPLEYREVLRRVVRDAGHEPVVADDRFADQHIWENIVEILDEYELKLAIFDITGLNPNVLIEVGYSLGLGLKKILILNLPQHLQSFGITQPQVPPPIPEDLAGIMRVQYNSLDELVAKLAVVIDQAIGDTLDYREKFDSIVRGVLVDARRVTIKETIALASERMKEDSDVLSYQNVRNWLEDLVSQGILIKHSGKPVHYQLRTAR